MSNKTEAPTPQRLERARREGDVAVSSSLMQAAGLLAAVLLAPTAARATATHAMSMLRQVLTSAVPPAPSAAILWLAQASLQASAPLLLAVVVVSTLVGLLQTRGLFAPSRLAPDLSRLSPTSLLRSLFSAQRASSIARALFTTTAVGYLIVARLHDHLGDLARTTGRVTVASTAAGAIAIDVGRDVALLCLALGVVDLVIAQRARLTRLKMTKDEVQREHRESEGDPQLKAARQAAHQELLTSATLQAVRDATVVIVNPTHLANALRYCEGHDEAPVLVAKGEGELAQQIIRVARQCGIPVVQDLPVARALAALQEGDAIPASLYEAVALILQEIEGEQRESDS